MTLIPITRSHNKDNDTKWWMFKTERLFLSIHFVLRPVSIFYCYIVQKTTSSQVRCSKPSFKHKKTRYNIGFREVEVNVNVNVNLYGALLHSACALNAPITAETSASSIGDRRWRCWVLDRKDIMLYTVLQALKRGANYPLVAKHVSPFWQRPAEHKSARKQK